MQLLFCIELNILVLRNKCLFYWLYVYTEIMPRLIDQIIILSLVSVAVKCLFCTSGFEKYTELSLDV